MSKIKKVVAVAALAASAAGTACAMQQLRRAYQLELENCTDQPLAIDLCTAAAPDAVIFEHLQPGEKRLVDLTRLPLGEHDVVYIRFPGTASRPAYQRTLIYDTNECKYAMHGMIVDYGDDNYDVKLVRRS